MNREEGISADRKVEYRVRKNGRKNKVIVERSAAEGLPEGWIKKLKISNRSGRNRRDPFFIDPKSEYIFHSFKDASRYVQTGDIGPYARKLKASDIEDDDDSGNGKTVLLLESADDVLEREKKINIHVRNSKRRNLSSSDEQSDNCKINSGVSSVTSQVLEDMGKKEEAKDPIEKQPIAKRVTRSQAKASKNEEVVDLKRKKPSSSNEKSPEDNVKSRLRSASSQEPKKEEDVQDSTDKRITRSKAKVKMNELSKVKTNELSNSVARRTSKRLAGIELGPTPELKTRTKVQRIGPPDDESTPELKTRTKAQRIVPPDDGTAGKCKQLVDVATSGLKKMDRPLNKEIVKSYNEHSSQKLLTAAATSNNRVSAEMAVGIENICKSVGRKRSTDRKTMKTPPPMIYELNPVFHLDGYKQKEEMSPVSPLSSQTSATKCEKTAAGKRLGRSSPKAKVSTSVRATKISPMGSSDKGKYLHPSDSGNAIQRRNKLGNELANSSVVRGTCSEVMEKNTNSFSSAYNSTLADLWKDPCIAFAIKTLTGESLLLPNTPALSSDPINNPAKQKGVSFTPETPGNVNTCSEKPGFSNAPQGTDIWKDPCINFAIKTLTGAIPTALDEPDAKSKSETITITTGARQEPESRQSNCDYLAQQCNMKNRTVGKPEDLRFTQSFNKD